MHLNYNAIQKKFNFTTSIAIYFTNLNLNNYDLWYKQHETSTILKYEILQELRNDADHYCLFPDNG